MEKLSAMRKEDWVSWNVVGVFTILSKEIKASLVEKAKSEQRLNGGKGIREEVSGGSIFKGH